MSPSCHFGMHHQGLIAARLTFPCKSMVGNVKILQDRTIVASTGRRVLHLRLDYTAHKEIALLSLKTSSNENYETALTSLAMRSYSSINLSFSWFTFNTLQMRLAAVSAYTTNKQTVFKATRDVFCAIPD